MRHFHVITGGPGSGKSTLLDYLENQGFARSMEAGRGIIQNYVSVEGPALPWKDRALYAELMLSWEMRSYREAERRGGNAPVLFDRGVPDVLGYLRLEGLETPPHILRAAQRFRYHPRVFLAPTWPEIFCQDEERRQDLETARRTHDVLADVYRELGYELVEVPRTSVDARAEFVRAHIG